MYKYFRFGFWKCFLFQQFKESLYVLIKKHSIVLNEMKYCFNDLFFHCILLLDGHIDFWYNYYKIVIKSHFNNFSQ